MAKTILGLCVFLAGVLVGVELRDKMHRDNAIEVAYGQAMARAVLNGTAR